MVGTKKITFAFNEETHHKLRVLAAIHNTHQTEIMTTLVKDEFAKLGLKLPDPRPPIQRAIDEAKNQAKGNP